MFRAQAFRFLALPTLALLLLPSLAPPAAAQNVGPLCLTLPYTPLPSASAPPLVNRLDVSLGELVVCLGVAVSGPPITIWVLVKVVGDLVCVYADTIAGVFATCISPNVNVERTIILPILP